MPTQIVMNNGDSLGDVLAQNLKGADSFLVATAYLNANGLERVMSPIERILDGKGLVNVVHGFYPQITETDAIRELARLADGSDQMSYGVYVDASRSLEGSFHRKMYLTRSQDNQWHAVVGSSNLTKGGLRSNLEVNCTFSGFATEPAIRQCRKVFDRIQVDPNIHRPTIGWIEAYDRIRNLEIKNRNQFQKETRDAYEELFNITQAPPWQAKKQIECVVKALQILENFNGKGTYHHIMEISSIAKQVVAGRFEETHWVEGIRKQLNTNTVYREVTSAGKSKRLFKRQDGDKGRSGRYRLSALGRSYRGGN